MATTIAIIVGILLIVLLVLAAAVLGYAATRPNTFRIERATSIKAPPEKIFPLLADFHNWGLWSPWEKIDPGLKRTYSGPASGPGAVYEWKGNKNVGTGRMEIAEASPPSKLLIKLDFLKPFEAHNFAEFTLAGQGDSTNLTWAMRGPNLFMGKVMGLFLDMDAMIGKNFETGLANLKGIAEK